MRTHPSHSRAIVTTLTMATVFAGALDAQRGWRNSRQGPPSRSSKNHSSVKAAFKGVVATARKSTVVVQCGGKQVALGTIVGADGYIVTKTSELETGEIVCVLPNGDELVATRLGDHYDNDLVMLKVDAKDLVPVQWSSAVGVKAGSWVAVPGQGEAPLAIGVMSAQVHDRDKSKFRRRSRNSSNRAYLGVTSNPGDDEIRLTEVRSGTTAEAAGLRVGDIILEFASHKIRSFDDLVARIGRHKVGDKVAIKLRRGDQELEVEAKLGRNPNLVRGRSGGSGSRANDRRGPISSQERIWGPLSEVRIGFGAVIQHDSVLKPNQCGGPLVNLDGEVVGVNISRVGRIETLALTGRVVREMLPALRQPKAPKKK